MKGQVGQQAHNIHHIQSHVIQGVDDGVYSCASDIGGVSSRVGGALPEDLFCKLGGSWQLNKKDAIVQHCCYIKEGTFYQVRMSLKGIV